MDEFRTHRRFAGAAALAILGRGIHDVEEFGAPALDFPIFGLMVPVLLAVLIPRFPRVRWLAWTALGWGLLNIVVGGMLSVLPLPIWPFEPAQTVSHYLAHLAYLLGYVPFTWLSWRALNSNTGPA